MGGGSPAANTYSGHSATKNPQSPPAPNLSRTSSNSNTRPHILSIHRVAIFQIPQLFRPCPAVSQALDFLVVPSRLASLAPPTNPDRILQAFESSRNPSTRSCPAVSCSSVVQARLCLQLPNPAIPSSHV
ncbi:unnamed protein product [Prunus armeniaca]|uniref:Uncharacterized protein n=1 Tax=Prunus armeniaca TaxID=36596 RepID=A0A6J5W120_PRUAR|nr:hypothetical protein GBA52_002908 [Prunus armeniaca]CAB4295249.1 unnamed protein product [Prunus armeniaca]